MRPNRVVAVLGASATALALLAVAPAGPAAGSPDPPRRVSSDDVAAANRAVSRAAATLGHGRSRLRGARAEVVDARTKVITERVRARAAAAAARRAAAASVAASAALTAARAGYAQARLDVGALVRTVYMQGPYSELEVVLTASDPGDFADRLAAVRSLGRSYDARIAELTAAKAALALREAQAIAAAQHSRTDALAAQRSLDAAAAAERAAATARARVARLVAARRHALVVARREQSAVAAQYRRYRAYQRRIAAQTRASGGGSPSAGGELRWPIPGAGTSGGVGWRVHPVYGYKSCHTGVDIRGWTGTPIHAAASGVVTLVVNEGAYGLHTIISHGHGLATMYAHQSRTIVHPGQRVAVGQVIGYVGATGWVTGPHLHFEVHVGGVPYDPMGWFGAASKHPVPCYRG